MKKILFFLFFLLVFPGLSDAVLVDCLSVPDCVRGFDGQASCDIVFDGVSWSLGPFPEGDADGDALVRASGFGLPVRVRVTGEHDGFMGSVDMSTLVVGEDEAVSEAVMIDDGNDDEAVTDRVDGEEALDMDIHMEGDVTEDDLRGLVREVAVFPYAGGVRAVIGDVLAKASVAGGRTSVSGWSEGGARVMGIRTGNMSGSTMPPSSMERFLASRGWVCDAVPAAWFPGPPPAGVSLLPPCRKLSR